MTDPYGLSFFKKLKKYFLGRLEPSKEAGSLLLFSKSFSRIFYMKMIFLDVFGGHLGVKKRLLKCAIIKSGFYNHYERRSFTLENQLFLDECN